MTDIVFSSVLSPPTQFKLGIGNLGWPVYGLGLSATTIFANKHPEKDKVKQTPFEYFEKEKDIDLLIFQSQTFGKLTKFQENIKKAIMGSKGRI